MVLIRLKLKTSWIASSFLEKILKGSHTSLWIRNVQMGLPSVAIAYITVYVKDAVAVQKEGFLGGYTGIVWTVIIVQAVGGLIVATVVKVRCPCSFEFVEALGPHGSYCNLHLFLQYADNVLKVFATSFSIIISCFISAFLFDFHPTLSFLVGASLVVTATVMYSAPERKPRRKSILPMTQRNK
jgi:solute carrier family 35 (UDP-sugar transporter), member A1/2/3